MSDAVKSTCHSGGARGADIAWGNAARRAGHVVIHHSFERHDTKAIRSELLVHSREALSEAGPRLVVANRAIQRRVPLLGTGVGNLVHRNWFQVRDSDSIYAVSNLKDGKVDGGTAWATQMFIDLRGGAPCAAYLFDQIARRWYKWEGAWLPVDVVPVPSGPYAGVGSRDLNEAGGAAIRGVYVPSAPITVPTGRPIPFRMPSITGFRR